MQVNQVNRSASVPRNVFSGYGNPILQGYDYNQDSQPKTMHRRESSLNNLDPKNISINAGKEVMRSSVQLDTLQDRGVSSSMILPSDASRRGVESRSRRQGSWGDFVARQGEAAKKVEYSEKMEDKIRAMKYREVLDNMVHQGKQKKLEQIKEAREETVDPVQLEMFSKLERNKAYDDKKQYYSELQRLINQKETQKQKEHQKKAEELQELRHMMSNMQVYESRVNEQEKLNKRQIYNDYQTAVNQKNQSYAEQKRREEEELMKASYRRDGHFFYRQDEERRQLYEKIRNQVNRNVGNQLADIEYEKKRQVDSFVNRAILQKEERDAMEMMRREELAKKRQMDAFENNRMIAAEKMMKNRKDREYREEEGMFMSEHSKMATEMEKMRKEQETSQKREYLDYLKSQAQAKQDARYRDDMMNATESRVNRVAPDSETSAYPFNGRSHERSLQLKYIDKWLTSGNNARK